MGGLARLVDIYLEKCTFTFSDVPTVITAAILGGSRNKIVNKTTTVFKQTNAFKNYKVVESSVIKNVKLINNGINQSGGKKLVSNKKLTSFINQYSRFSIKTGYSGVVTSISQNASVSYG